ncbi:hypothetical protein [Paenibacillus sp. y28]|uniref:hypothetical protein n=1 Tax=Paenibacillus sp. y28 TaxID=3129110 RepID=UPI003015E72A
MEERHRLTLNMECVLFFQQNPYTLETADGIAMRLGRKRQDLEPVLHQMESNGVVQKSGQEPDAIYRYVSPDVYSS